MTVADPSVEIFREDRRVRYVERVSQRSGNPKAFDVVVLSPHTGGWSYRSK